MVGPIKKNLLLRLYFSDSLIRKSNEFLGSPGIYAFILFIADKGFDKQYGARPLKRAIQKYVEDALAEEIITSKIANGDQIFMDLDEDNQELTVTIQKAENPAD